LFAIYINTCRTPYGRLTKYAQNLYENLITYFFVVVFLIGLGNASGAPIDEKGVKNRMLFERRMSEFSLFSL